MVQALGSGEGLPVEAVELREALGEVNASGGDPGRRVIGPPVVEPGSADRRRHFGSLFQPLFPVPVEEGMELARRARFGIQRGCHGNGGPAGTFFPRGADG